jgi:hypothetical protein
MINCLKHFILVPNECVELILPPLLFYLSYMLIIDKHLDADRFKSLMIFQEYRILYDFCYFSLLYLVLTPTLFSIVKFNGSSFPYLYSSNGI